MERASGKQPGWQRQRQRPPSLLAKSTPAAQKRRCFALIAADGTLAHPNLTELKLTRLSMLEIPVVHAACDGGGMAVLVIIGS
jgi:hypothetical protein